MDAGVPSEIKAAERRVGLTPAAAGELVNHGHSVTIETGAGVGAGFTDLNYREVGAVIADTAADVFNHSEIIIKVKEPLPPERTREKRDRASKSRGFIQRRRESMVFNRMRKNGKTFASMVSRSRTSHPPRESYGEQAHAFSSDKTTRIS